MLLRELYENLLLFENYNGKLNKLKTEFPDQAADIDGRVTWAKQVFNDRNQSMLWYISLYEAWLKQNIDPNAKTKYETMLGGHPPINDFATFESELNHWLGTPRFMLDNRSIQLLSKINAQTTTVDALIKNLTAVEEEIRKADEEEKKNKTPVTILEGDHIVLPLGNQGDWWLLPKRSHEPESKFMGHCGTTQGSSNILLSLRDKVPVPWVTMEYNLEKKVLHQMKGRTNSKPATKFHYAILSLLLSDLVDGIYTGSTYQPGSDFSIFDMKEDLINQIIQTKPKLIENQIDKFPIDFLRSPLSVKANPEYRTIALNRLPGLQVLVDDAGNVSTDNDTWEKSIKSHQMMIIYAPHTVQDWETRVTNYLVNHNSSLGYCDNRIRSNFNIMKTLIQKSNPAAIELVPYRAPQYKELAQLALAKQPSLIKAVNTDGWSTEEVKAAWMKAASRYMGTNDWPAHLFTESDTKYLWRELIAADTDLIVKVPEGLFNQDELVDIWTIAIQHNEFLVLRSEFNTDRTISEESKDKIRIWAIRKRAMLISKFRPDLIKDEAERIKIWSKAIVGYPHLIDELPNALIPGSDKIKLSKEIVRKNPSYVSKYGDLFSGDELIELWTAACDEEPRYLKQIPEHLLNDQRAAKKLWSAAMLSDRKHIPFNLNEIPDGLFDLNELRAITTKVLEKDPSQVKYAHPDLITKEVRMDTIKKSMIDDVWNFIKETDNPTPLGPFTREEIQDMWNYALDKIINNDDDDDNRGYLLSSDWLPYPLLDHNLIKDALFKAIEYDYAENDSILRHINYNVFSKILTPADLTKLHILAIHNSNNGEGGGPFAAIPLRYQTFDLAERALRHDLYQMDAVIASGHFDEDQLNELREIARHPTEDEGLQEYIRDEMKYNEDVNFRTDYFEGQQ